jgi:hypothetical protein
MEVVKQRLRVPGWRIGVFLGDALWLLAFAFFFAVQSNWLPRWLTRSHVIRTVAGYCGLFALPIPLGGWLYVWGDNGPPYEWIDSVAVNTALGILFYGLLGGLLGYVATLIRHHRFSIKAMLIVFTLVALLLGIATAVMNLFRNSAV